MPPLFIAPEPLATPWSRARIVARLLVGVSVVIALLRAFAQPRPSPTVPAWFAALPDGDAGQFFAARTVRTKKLQLSDETRNAIVARSTYPLRRTLTPVAGQRWQIAMAAVCSPNRPCAGGAQFRIDAIHDGGRENIVRQRVNVEPSGPHWRAVWMDLDRFAGTSVELELNIIPLAGRATHAQRTAPVAVWSEPLSVTPAQAAPPNVLLISIDTLRADHLGSYGHTRATSPHLDALAADGVRFATAISQAPWTTPSHMSLMTSLYPSTHRINLSLEQQTTFQRGQGPGRVLASQHTTLAAVLRAHGYRTLAMTGGATLGANLGFARGFDIYNESAAHLTAPVTQEIEQWLDEFGRGPFFAFLHTFEVHAPYRHLDFVESLISPDDRQSIEHLLADAVLPNGGWVPLIRTLRTHLEQRGLFRSEITSALYDGGILFVDRFLGQLFTALRARGLYDRTIIIVTSDHGEEFGEHDPARIYNQHCVTLYDELIHVPLIMHLPQQSQPGRVIDDQVETIDIAPTILDLLGIAPLESWQGSSLKALVGGQHAPRKDWALSESTCSGPERKGLRTAEAKYVATFDVREGDRSGTAAPLLHGELFDLRADPREQNNRAATGAADAERFQAQLEQILGNRSNRDAASVRVPFGADVNERLRALGYAP